jgi:NADPH:quinone reductase-like Zn-dependent oxidoreductase
VIDYTQQDFTRGDQHYDLIFDLVGNHSFSERRRILNANGICVMAGVGGAGWREGILGRLAGELNAYARSRFTSQKFLTFLARINQKDLSILADLMQTGKVTPVVDKTFRLTQTPDAVRYLETGHARGKVVINLE